MNVLEKKLSALVSSSSIGKVSLQVVNLKKKVASCIGAISHLKSEIRKMEDECKSLDGRLQDSEESLYGGKITSPKELTQLQMKSSEYREARKKLEEKLLQSLYQLEEEEERVKEIEEEQIKISQELEILEQDLKHERRQLEVEISECQEELNLLEPYIPQEMRSRFFLMMERMNGLAIALVKEGACGVCHVLLSPAIMERLKKADSSMITCENCGRILFIGRETK